MCYVTQEAQCAPSCRERLAGSTRSLERPSVPAQDVVLA